MDITTLNNYFLQYGSVFIFAIVLLEYMNLPGFPAGIIMPLSGIWAAKGDISFLQVLCLSVAAGLIGSWLLYFLGRFGGESFFRFYTKKYPEQKETIEKYLGILREKGSFSNPNRNSSSCVSISAGVYYKFRMESGFHERRPYRCH